MTMLSYQEQMYNDMMKLVNESDAFYSVDHKLGGSIYRVFTYRLASYTDFLKPNALNARGVMFEITENGGFVRLASLPMAKFFNDGENPMTMNLDYSKVKSIMDKRDGSLISTFVHSDGSVRLKSKTSISSEQAVGAMKYLDKNERLKKFVEAFVAIDYTVNFEYTAPFNRIVLAYQQEELRILNVRSNKDGRIYTLDDIAVGLMTFSDLWVDHYPVTEDIIKTLKEDKSDIEGYIVVFEDGTWAKIKTDWYLSLHRLKDSITNDYHLFCAIINEAADDLKASFAGDEFAINRINTMEAAVIPRFNHMVAEVTKFHAENKDLDRKSFALKVQAEMNGYLGPLMVLYQGKTPDFKAYADKHYKTFIQGAEMKNAFE